MVVAMRFDNSRLTFQLLHSVADHDFELLQRPVGPVRYHLIDKRPDSFGRLQLRRVRRKKTELNSFGNFQIV